MCMYLCVHALAYASDCMKVCVSMQARVCTCVSVSTHMRQIPYSSTWKGCGYQVVVL